MQSESHKFIPSILFNLSGWSSKSPRLQAASILTPQNNLENTCMTPWDSTKSEIDAGTRRGLTQGNERLKRRLFLLWEENPQHRENFWAFIENNPSLLTL